MNTFNITCFCGGDSSNEIFFPPTPEPEKIPLSAYKLYYGLQSVENRRKRNFLRCLLYSILVRAGNKARQRKTVNISLKSCLQFISTNLQHENKIHSTLKYTLVLYVDFYKKNVPAPLSKSLRPARPTGGPLKPAILLRVFIIILFREWLNLFVPSAPHLSPNNLQSPVMGLAPLHLAALVLA